MAGFLFHDIIFGPVRSRRLGLSLGINLLPIHGKHCSFNCIYCECGWTPAHSDEPIHFPDRQLVYAFLEQRLKEMIEEDYLPDALTFAGNGEPTLHPDFEGIVDDTMVLRDKYIPGAKGDSPFQCIHDPRSQNIPGAVKTG
jgi:wyosine [tRNA(Phe)-imidazoG37] synthetase (radical SAM superfamily)